MNQFITSSTRLRPHNLTPPSFPMPQEVHSDPLLIIENNEPHCQASVKAFTAQDTSSSSMPVGLKDSQGDSSKKEECITTEQDIHNKVPVVSTSSGLSDLVSPHIRNQG